MAKRWFLRLAMVPLLVAATVSARPADPGSISTTDLRDWLGFIASDELQGRQVFTEGLGLAAEYIAEHLAEWHVTPMGDNGSYFQTVKVLGVRTTSRASVTIEVNGERRTFKDGEGVTFPKKMGSAQRISGKEVVFVGYGLQLPAAGLDDYADVHAGGKVVVFLGQGPDVEDLSFRLLNARPRLALQKGAAATIAPLSTRPVTPRLGAAGGDNGDFTTTERYDVPIPPSVTATDDFYEFLFSGSGVTYADLKQKASRKEPLPHFALSSVKLTINVDADYAIVRTRLTRNVVGSVAGTDPALKDTYVAFGAHYDHIGYLEGSDAGRGVALFSTSCPGQARDTPRPGDVVNNGADDDGSGTVGVLALAKAFALGPKPKRSLLFVWHSGEEAGLYGSRYYVDHPIVPLERLSAQLNIDMIGRNRCDDPKQEDTVYLVGADRISSELHNLNEDANGTLAKPLDLNYDLNDPADPESIYTRSDHYSYAAKGVPIIFFTTGLHRDYHYVTDEVSKIDFAKLARVTGLVYATGLRVANLDHAPVRDNKGPRKGRGGHGRIGS